MERKIYEGNITIESSNVASWEEKLKDIDEISGDLYINAQAKLDNLKSVGGGLYIYAQSKLEAPNLKSVGGYLYIYAQAKLDNLKSVGRYLSINAQLPSSLEKQLWRYNHKKQWRMSDGCSDWLLKREGDIRYIISGIEFPKNLFDGIRKDTLTAQEVFSITNMEQRRIAYERMDKIKMKDLPNLTVKDEIKDDGYGYPMRIISFDVKGFDKPFRFLNCYCPSTGREFFLETQTEKSWLAKNKSFGLEDKTFRFSEEW